MPHPPDLSSTNVSHFCWLPTLLLAHGHGCRTSITWITLWVVPAKAVQSYHVNVLVSAPSAVWSRFGFRIKAKVNAPKPKKTVKTHKGKV